MKGNEAKEKKFLQMMTAGAARRIQVKFILHISKRIIEGAVCDRDDEDESFHNGRGRRPMSSVETKRNWQSIRNFECCFVSSGSMSA